MSVSKADRSGLGICARAALLGLAMSSLGPTPSRADAPIVGEYLQLPSSAQPADTPNALNRVAFLRIYDKDAQGRADAIILFQDGVTAGGWGVLGKQLVDMAARRGKWIEVWMMDRREKNLEDRLGFANAIAQGDPSVALHYYYGDSALDTNGKFISTAPLGGSGASYIPLGQTDVPFMANWGADVLFGDMETLLDLIPAQYRKTNVVLMGNFTGAFLVTSFAGHRLRDGNRAYQELAALIMTEGTPTPPTGVQPSASDITSYLASVQGLRNGTLLRYSTTSLTSGVQRDLASNYIDVLPHSETIFRPATGAAGGTLADQFVAALRLTNLAYSGFNSSDDPIPGTFLTSFAVARGTLRAGVLDFTPVAGTEGTCAAPGPFGLVPPCVPPISQIDPNHVYDWLDGGAGNPGAAGNPLGGWTESSPGVFTNAYVVPGEKPTALSGAIRDTYNNADETNVQPVQVTFPVAGEVTLDAFPSHSYAWYLNNRFQSIDMPFIGKYQTVYIQDDSNNIHIDVDKTAVTGIPLISYVTGYQTTPPINPFAGVDDFTAVYRDGTQQTAQAATVGPLDSRVSTRLYHNGDFYYADNSLADQVLPGENGANVVSASLMDWLIPRLGGSQIDVPNEVACRPSDQCHVAGMPDAATGACSKPAAPDGTACNDSNACTQADVCQSGSCVGTNFCPTDKTQCKHGGWLSLMKMSGQPFKNQGGCVRYVEDTGSKGNR